MKVIDDYFSSTIHKPFYMVVGDSEYKEIIDKLKSRAISVVRVSDCCQSTDKVPDLDTLREKLETADISCDYNNVILLGLGEYLALCGESKTRDYLNELSDFNLGSAQVVILLRCVENQIKALIKNDKRLVESGRVSFGDDLSTAIYLKLSDPGLGIYSIYGIKNLLKTLEDGLSGDISANTDIQFSESIIPIQYVKDSYEAIAKNIDIEGVPKECGTEELWERMLFELRDHKFDANQLFDEYGFSSYQDADFYDLLYGEEYKSWLFYISLVMDKKSYDGKYLGCALKKGVGISSFRQNVLNAIISITHNDPVFPAYYRERKRLLSHYPEAEMATFVNENRKDAEESVYRLTDNTLVEKQEIIIWIANYGIPDNLLKIYPDLAAYIALYSFSGNYIDSAFAARLTSYFAKYKELKLNNNLTEEFSEEVEKLAKERIYNRLPKRDEIVKEKNNGSTQLFWIDALGVEYLSYIVGLARKRGLKLSIEIGRSELPTITSINSDFYKNWPEELRHPKEEELDDVKHKEKGGYYYSTKNPYPIHLAKELEIIDRALSDIATTLALRTYDRVVIASDHGASRLAVLKNKEEKYETDTRGEHSGRCCKYFKGCDLPYAINEEDRGYIVLADYGRFKGSRAANVEVHGGASLEEVIVPIITLSLKDSSIVITVINEEKIKADYKTGIKVQLYVNKKIREKLMLGFDNDRYTAERLDDNHYVVDIPNIKRAGIYSLDVFLGEDLVTRLQITARGMSASVNDDFDDLF